MPELADSENLVILRIMIICMKKLSVIIERNYKLNAEFYSKVLIIEYDSSSSTRA